MNVQELNEKITALIDGEISSKKEREELELAVHKDISNQKEFLIQKSVKSALSSRFSSTKAPSHLYENIVKQSLNLHYAEKENISQKNNSAESKSIFNIFFKPKFAIPFAVLIVALFLSSPLFSERSPHELVFEQAGSNNMYVQAINNFKSILQGELSVQCTSSSPEEVKKYFVDSGVPYETKVPTFQHWNLLGGVVSEDNGKKFAHQVYAGEQNKILYLYQVDIDLVSDENHPLKLSKELISFLHEGKCLRMLDSSYKTFLWENDHKFYALVTNEDPQLIEDNFLASF